MTLFLNTVAARLSAILHKASDREWHAEREGRRNERDEIVIKCGEWFKTEGCVAKCVERCARVRVCVCVYASECNVGGMEGWHAEFVIALPHVKDWPRDSAVYLWPAMV